MNSETQLFLLQEVVSPCSQDSLCTAAHVQFEKNIVHVLLDRADADDKLLGDFPIGCAIGDQMQHLKLAFTERLKCLANGNRCLCCNGRSNALEQPTNIASM